MREEGSLHVRVKISVLVQDGDSFSHRLGNSTFEPKCNMNIRGHCFEIGVKKLLLFLSSYKQIVNNMLNFYFCKVFNLYDWVGWLCCVDRIVPEAIHNQEAIINKASCVGFYDLTYVLYMCACFNIITCFVFIFGGFVLVICHLGLTSN